MQPLNFLTGNAGKFKEMAVFLSAAGISLKQISTELEEIQDVDAKKIIEHKAQVAIKAGYKNFFLEDTSLYIHGMGQLPGPLIKWFLSEIRTKGIAKLAASMGNSKAMTETIIAFVDGKKDITYFVGTTHGRIVQPRGTGDFGWGATFQPNGSAKTFAQMSVQEKQAYSTRIKALKRALRFFKRAR